MYTQRSYWSILCVNWMMVELREYENTKHQYKARQNWHDLKERLSTISLFTNLRHSAITTDQHTPVRRLGKQAKHARHTHERWLARATSPLSYILLRSPGITIATTLVAFQKAPHTFIDHESLRHVFKGIHFLQTLRHSHKMCGKLEI